MKIGAVCSASFGGPEAKTTKRQEVMKKKGSGVRSYWFFAGYDDFSPFFTIFHIIFHRQAIDFSPVTQITAFNCRIVREVDVFFDDWSGDSRRLISSWKTTKSNAGGLLTSLERVG
jgi:hypothetical protein